jgi:hypothetical protein
MRNRVVRTVCSILLLTGLVSAGCKQRSMAAGEHEGHGGHGGNRAHADHEPRHGGVVTMWGDVHPEIVVEPSGRVRVYLSDAMRNEADVFEVTGEMVRQGPDGGMTRVALRPVAAMNALMAEADAPVDPFTAYQFSMLWKGERIYAAIRVSSVGTTVVAER